MHEMGLGTIFGGEHLCKLYINNIRRRRISIFMAPSAPMHNPADDEQPKVTKEGSLFFTRNCSFVPCYYRVSSGASNNKSPKGLYPNVTFYDDICPSTSKELISKLNMIFVHKIGFNSVFVEV